MGQSAPRLEICSRLRSGEFSVHNVCLVSQSNLLPHFRVRSTRDVMTFLGVSLHCSLSVGAIGTGILVFNGEVPPAKFLQASFNWWIGDAVAISSVTLFLLEYVLPRCRVYLGLASYGTPQSSDKSSNLSARDLLECLGFATAFASLIYFDFFNIHTREADLNYLFLLPLIGVALRHGIRGVIVALILVDSSLAFTIHAIHQDIMQMAT